MGIRTRLVDRHVADRKTVNIETKIWISKRKTKIIRGQGNQRSSGPNDVRPIALERESPSKRYTKKLPKKLVTSCFNPNPGITKEHETSKKAGSGTY
ncbi:MAG: hypothetical protein Ct9H300mP11_17660 [Chloroflexota bacterium]|nr:MAG: hypothetical protein Ct9H300mP11_17660 [Chloroflexota bacterium]